MLDVDTSFAGRRATRMVDLIIAVHGPPPDALVGRVPHVVFVRVARDGVMFGTVLREVPGRVLDPSNTGEFGDRGPQSEALEGRIGEVVVRTAGDAAS